MRVWTGSPPAEFTDETMTTERPTGSPASDAAMRIAAQQIISQFGGIRPMANKLGVAVSTVQGWRERGAIPPRHHQRLRAAAEAHGVEIDPQDLALLRADSQENSRRTLRAVTGTAFLMAGAILTGLDAGPWFLNGLSIPGLASMSIGAWLLIRTHRR